MTISDVTNNFDYVFWCGDLNFRLGEPRAAVLRWIEQTEVIIYTNKLWKDLYFCM